MRKRSLIFLFIFFIILFFQSTAKIKINATTYIDPDSEFRAVWITPITGDIGGYSSVESYKTEINNILDIMEYYNLNVMIFHVRTHNNALYNSSLNPVASWWKTVNFSNFDPLEWVINACHERGIEFHAWLNPYRVDSTKYGEGLPSINPASNSNNLLTYNGNIILNPGLPEVRSFLIDTCMEVVENYDVDAIHFDDYFYINLGANGATSGANTILNEPDQATFEANLGSYSTTSALDKASWRRDQINIFIDSLHQEITLYNQTNNRHVQLGIAPTGIYKNGNGVVSYDENGHPITTGSDTGGQEHYNSYLFCDSLKWCKEGWIDYIIPQTYWATNHSVAAYAKVIGWWDKVVKYLDVNLYSGIGLYFADWEGSTAWQTDSNELLNQLTHITTLENVKGASIYSYKYIRNAYNGGNANSASQVANLGTNCWTRKVVLPELKSMTPVTLNAVNNLTQNNSTLTWDQMANTKFYAIYRSNTTVTFSSSELVDIIGSSNSPMSWTDSNSGNYQYGVRPISYTNTLGVGRTTYNVPTISLETDTGGSKGTEVTNNGGAVNQKTIQVGFTRHAYLGNNGPSVSRLDYNWTSSDASVATISQYGTIEALKIGRTTIKGVYKNDSSYWGEIEIVVYDKYTVVFKDWDGTVLSTQTVRNNTDAILPITPVREGYTFAGWDKSHENIISSCEINAQYVISTYQVVFKDGDNILSTQIINHGSDAIPPQAPEKEWYVFVSWDSDYTNIVCDKTINANYRKVEYSITLSNNRNLDNVIKAQIGENVGQFLEGNYGEQVILEADNLQNTFLYWVVDGYVVSIEPTMSFKLTKNHHYVAYYATSDKYTVSFVDSNMKLIDVVDVDLNEQATTNLLPSVKPGYIFDGWRTIGNVEQHQIVYATYTSKDNLFNVSVENGEIVGSTATNISVKQGDLVTFKSSNLNFSYWMLDNEILSYQNELTISIYQDINLVAVINENIYPELLIYAFDAFVDEENKRVAFYGRFDNPDSLEIVELGVIYKHGELVDPLETIGASHHILNRHNAHNEFAAIFNLIEDDGISMRFYFVINHDGVYLHTYSQLKHFSYQSNNQLTLELNGGNLYQYSSREELVNDFLSDISLFFNKSFTTENFFDSSYQKDINSFFYHESYQRKWLWLHDYIITVGETNQYSDLNQLQNGVSEFWRSNIWAFLNSSIQTSWPASIDFTIAQNANGFWDNLLIVVPTNYEQGVINELPIPRKEGFTFMGWYENFEFTGVPITTISEDAKGCKTYYAKWEQ